MIDIIPAIDIISGKCVRLTKGDYQLRKVYDASPIEMAMAYCDCGVHRIHMVDLDGAKVSSPKNLKTLEEVASHTDCEIEWGGGIASLDDLKSAFSAGASHTIVGSVAALHPEKFEQWMKDTSNLGKLILGADVRNGRVAVKGWVEETELTVESLVNRFEPIGLKEAIVTDISRDGMLQGPSFQLYTKLQTGFPSVNFTVSGGISSMDDISVLDSLGLRKVIVGKAIYENRITLKQITEWLLNA